MIAVLACTASNAQAQLIAGRTNALLWGNLTPNFSLELVTSNRTSVMTRTRWIVASKVRKRK
mgnify:CR=1 FL=1